MNLAERIALWRQAKGLTQRELADAVGVSAAAVYQWEGTGKSQTDPSMAHLEALVGALGITMRRFYGPVPRRKGAA